MKRYFAVVLIAVAIAVGGCIFSPDDDPPAAKTDSAWQPELWVTPDSVSAFFPNDWPDSTRFEWNVFPENIPEYVMEAVVRLQATDFHLVFMRLSDDGPRQQGSFSEMAAGALGYFWQTDPITGQRLGRVWPFADVHVLPDGVLVRLARSLAGYVYAYPQPGSWPVKFQRRGLFKFAETNSRVRYGFDTAQLRARRVSGPLDADDYVVMDVVLRSYYEWQSPSTVVVAKTVVLPFRPTVFFGGYDLIERDMLWMYPDHDTHAAFNVARLRQLDASALSQLGYSMVESGSPPVPGAIYLSVSAVGYNHDRDQALVWASYYCGDLCAEARLFMLEKMNGYWVIKDQVQLWIS